MDVFDLLKYKWSYNLLSSLHVVSGYDCFNVNHSKACLNCYVKLSATEFFMCS